MRVKKYMIWLTLLAMITYYLAAENDPKKLEAGLSGQTGKERIETLIKLTEIYQDENKEKALKFGQEALTLLTTGPHKETRKHAALLNRLSYVASRLGKYETGVDYAKQCLEITEKNGDEREYAGALRNMAWADKYLPNYDRAIDSLTRAKKIYEKLGDTSHVANCFNDIGLVYRRLNNYTEALDNILKAGKIFEELGNKNGLSSVYNNTGFIHLTLGNLDIALEHSKKAVAFSREINDIKGVAITNGNIGMIYDKMGKRKEALTFYKKSIADLEKLGEKKTIATHLFQVGYHYEMDKDFNQALEYLNRSLKIKEEIKEPYGIAQSLLHIGAVMRKTGRYRDALTHLNRSLEISNNIDAKHHIRDNSKELSETYEAMKDDSRALEYYKKYKEFNDSIFNEEKSEKVAEMQTRFDTEKNEKEISLLQKGKEIQQLELAKQTNLKNSLIIVSLLVALLAFVIYTRYRLKTRVTRALTKEIANHKETTHKLRESEEKFRGLAEKSVVGIFITQDNRVKYVNPRFLKLFGFEEEEIIGSDPMELILEDDRPFVMEKLERTMAVTGEFIAFQFRGLNKEGEIIYLESYGSRTLYDDAPAILETLIDITDRKKAEAELVKSQKLESIGILAGGIAHDFNNLLAVIIGNLSLARESIEEGDTGKQLTKALQKAEKSSLQAADLARKLITFSDGGWFVPEGTKLTKVLKDVMEMPDIREVVPSIAIPSDLPPVYGDERQLRQVFHNLLQNAREAMAGMENGQTVIEAENFTLSETNPFQLEPGDYVKVSIKDAGKGIPRTQLEKIFDPYFSTKGTVTQKGMGLGLTICYSIIKKHNGFIGVESEEGKGTVVNLYLPAYLAYESST